MSQTIHHENYIEYKIDRPRHGNSFGLKDAENLEASLERCIEKELPLLLSAGGRIFCAGGDVKEYASHDSDKLGRQINKKIREVLNKVSKLPLPTVATVQGDCYGGGIELISAFDKVFSSSHCLFGFWQRRIGLTFGWGGGERLAKRLPERKLLQLGLEARSITAEEAHSLGLIDQVVPSQRLRVEAESWILKQARWPKAPLPVLKGDLLENEEKAFEKLWFNPEHKAALSKV